MARKPPIVPIPGTRNREHLLENLGANDLQLTPADLKELDAACSSIAVHGGRMNEMQMQVVDPEIDSEATVLPSTRSSANGGAVCGREVT